ILKTRILFYHFSVRINIKKRKNMDKEMYRFTSKMDWFTLWFNLVLALIIIGMQENHSELLVIFIWAFILGIYCFWLIVRNMLVLLTYIIENPKEAFCLLERDKILK